MIFRNLHWLAVSSLLPPPAEETPFLKSGKRHAGAHTSGSGEFQAVLNVFSRGQIEPVGRRKDDPLKSAPN